LPAKLAAEVQTQSGHDLIDLRMHLPIYYESQLVDITDVVVPLAEKNGGMYAFCEEASLVKGLWRAMPWYHLSFPGSYNKSHFDQVGEKPPDTWDDLLRAGKKLKANGHPIGIAISQTFDSISTLSGVMWCCGAKAVEADGKTVAIHSKETAAAIEYVQQLFHEAMEPEVLSWDDASNNRCVVSGHCSWIHNPISAYETARTKNMPIHHDIYLHPTPAGPAGRYWGIGGGTLGIWTFSKQIDLAKEFLAYLFAEENYSAWIVASNGFNHPALRSYEDHPIWQQNPKFTFLPKEGQYGRARGWPAKPNEFIQIIEDNYILPDMVAKAVTGTPIDQAIQWGEDHVRKVLEGKAG
jgi:multiple sugar transport system substrate-binding protein